MACSGVATFDAQIIRNNNLKDYQMKKAPIAMALGAVLIASCNHNAVDFATVDADSNGHVTTEEVAAAAPNLTPENFQAADANGNGVLSAEEYAVAIAQ